MIKRMFALLLTIAFVPAFVAAEVTPGAAAPSFEVTDATGKVHKLSDYAGKWVVLEWFNKECPFVKKHYGSGNMQRLQKTYGEKDVAWLTVISSAKGKQGYLEPAAAQQVFKDHNAAPHAILLDSSGTMGRAYGAKTTPHMFVIDPKGNLVYAGAIDSDDSSSPDSIANATNYVAAALDAAMAGKPVQVASTRAYGCSVKY